MRQSTTSERLCSDELHAAACGWATKVAWVRESLPSSEGSASMNLNCKKACQNCPFKKVGAIDLAPGRVDQIARDLIRDDGVPFLCHKTLSGSRDEEDGGGSTYRPGHRDSVCAGSMVFLLKARAPNVAMRLGVALGELKYADLETQFDTIIDPLPDHFSDDHTN